MLLLQEEEWKQALEHLSMEVDGKLDRLALGALRDELQAQLRALATQLSSLQRDVVDETELREDEAAGIRRQLLQPFNCISCDKRLHMVTQKYAIRLTAT